MFRILSVAVVLGLVAGPAWGQDKTYTIKIKKLGQGGKELVEKDSQSSQAIKIEDNTGNVVKEQTEKKDEKFVYETTILEKKPGQTKATRLERKYKTAVITKDGATTPLPYQGKTVLIEKKGERYVFRIKGGEELTGESAEELNKQFNKKGELDEATLEKLLLPGKAVKVGEEWTIDSKQVTKAIQEEGSLELVPNKTKATGKLTRVYKKGGHQFGVIALHLEITPKSVTKDGMKVVLQPKSRMVVKGKIDACIDGSSSTGTMSMEVDAHIEALLPSPDQPMFKLIVTVRGKGTDKSVEK